MSGVNIGRAAARSGVSAKMIRYYEQVGLIPPALRSASGYRVYDDNAIHTLRFVRRARELGFSMDEIHDLLGLWRDRGRQSRDVKRVAQQHIAELEARIAKLQQVVDTLQHLADCCAGNHRPQCPILDELGGAANLSPRPAPVADPGSRS